MEDWLERPSSIARSNQIFTKSRIEDLASGFVHGKLRFRFRFVGRLPFDFIKKAPLSFLKGRAQFSCILASY